MIPVMQSYHLTRYVYTTCYSALVINIITTAAVDQILLSFYLYTGVSPLVSSVAICLPKSS